jgi:hypothetical protein
VLLAGKLQTPDAETWTAISLTRRRETRFVPETKSTNCRPTTVHWRELVLGSLCIKKMQRADALELKGVRLQRVKSSRATNSERGDGLVPVVHVSKASPSRVHRWLRHVPGFAAGVKGAIARGCYGAGHHADWDVKELTQLAGERQAHCPCRAHLCTPMMMSKFRPGTAQVSRPHYRIFDMSRGTYSSVQRSTRGRAARKTAYSITRPAHRVGPNGLA